MRRATVGAALLTLIALTPGGAASADLHGRVVGVQDGDTLTLFVPGRPQTKVRLVEIDAPETGQPYGQKSKQVLSGMVFGRTVRVESEGRDRYGRTLGRVYAGPTDVNAEMVRRGAAWVYRDYSTDSSLPPLESRARRERVGLWSLQPDQIVAPWDWRRGRRSAVGSAPRPPVASSRVRPGAPAWRCTAKTRCAEMRSCSEARYHLQQCGAARLDGDRDGVPCEAICR